MGNESSLIANCKLEREVAVVSPKPWRLYQSKRKDSSHLSVFVYEPDQLDTLYIENAAKYLKVLRHPTILKFDDVEHTSEGIWLATEQVTPLESVLEDLSSQEIVAGIYNIVEGLVFLHDRAGLSHNNICLSSVFVSEDGSWRIGGLEYLCRFDQASAAYLSKCKKHRDSNSVAPEEKTGNLSSLDHGWARDVFGFGVLMDILMEYIADVGDLKKTFEIRVQDECLNASPNKRPRMSSFLDDCLFKNDFVEIANFLKNVTLKSEVEKRQFFGTITQKLYNLPVKLLASRLVRPLLSRFVLLDRTSCQTVIPHLLTPYKEETRPAYSKSDINPLLPQNLFKKYVVPEVFKIFHVRDAHIRLVLLAHFDYYVDQFESNVLQRVLLPQILLGLHDTNDDLVRLSLHAVAALVPILGGDVVVGTQRTKIFSESTPKFTAVSPASVGSSVGDIISENFTNNMIVSVPPKNPSKMGSETSPKAEKKTLIELAKESEREKRRLEIKKRNAERQQRRQERSQKVAGTGEPESGRFVKDGISSEQYDERMTLDNMSTVTEGDDRLQASESDIDREIEEELKAMGTSLSPGAVTASVPSERTDIRSVSEHRTSTEGHVSLGVSKGAPLKLKSKMRTSPPPSKKTSPAGDHQSQEMSTPKSTPENDGWGDSWGDVDTEKWADGDDEESNADLYEKIYPDAESSPTSKHSTKSTSSTGLSAVTTPPSTPSELTPQKPPQRSGMSLKVKQKQADKSAPPVPRAKTVELDITKLDIKTSGTARPAKTDTDDLFADMQPNIDTSKNSLWNMLNKNSLSEVKGDVNDPTSKTKENNIASSKSSLKFDVVNSAPAEDEFGWGDDNDLNWDGADF